MMIVGLALAGCQRGLPSHEGASFGISPDGKSIVWTTGAGGNNELWIRDAQGERMLADGRYFEGPTFAPDGRIVVSVGDGFRNRLEFLSYDVATGGVKPLLPIADMSQYSAVYSSDGQLTFRGAGKPRSRAFGGLQWNDFDLYVWDGKADKPRKLTDGKFIRMSAPTWSPDGRTIAFSFVDSEGVSWLRLVDTEKGETVTETKLQHNESMPTYLGDRLVVVSDRKQMGKYRLVYIEPETGEIEPITRTPGYFLEPVAVAGSLYALEDVSHKMRFRVTKIDPKTGAGEEVIAETAFDAKPKPQP